MIKLKDLIIENKSDKKTFDKIVKALKDIKVRRALNYAFDRDLMMQYLRNNIGTPAHSGFIPKGLPGFQPRRGYKYDLELAKCTP